MTETASPPPMKPRGLIGLSNELLTAIVRNLDPPTAVCMALSCKKFHLLVPIACCMPLSGICPKFPIDMSNTDVQVKNLPLLAPHFASARRLAYLAASRTAFTMVKRQVQLLTGKTISDSVVTPAYADLIEKISLDCHDLEEDWICRAKCHLTYPRDADRWTCMICLQTDFVDAGRHLARGHSVSRWELVEAEALECWDPDGFS